MGGTGGGRGGKREEGEKREEVVSLFACDSVDSSMCSFFISLPAVPENMYVYEGKDYSKSSDADRKTFDQLLAG